MFYSYDRQQHLLKPSVKTPGEATYAPEPCFASVLPVPTAEELSFSHGERPPKAVVRYRILAYRRLLHHTVRNEAAIKLLQTLPDNMIVKMCIRYYLPEEQKCGQKEFYRIITKTIERVCVFLEIGGIDMEIRAGKCGTRTDLLLEENSFLSIELFDGFPLVRRKEVSS